MKLIRLTSDTNDGRFDNDYNDEIIIPPNSKVALQSLAVLADITGLQINGDNEVIQFEVKTGQTRTISLNHETYDQHNHHLFLNDLQLQLNQGLVYTDGQTTANDQAPSELGMQMKVQTSNKGKVNIDIANTKYTYTTANLFDTFKENTTAGINKTGTPMKLASATATGTGRADSKHGMASINPFTTGCGVFRVKLNTWVDDGSGATSTTSGFEFGLCNSKPDTWDLPDGMPDTVKTFAIRGFQPGTNYYMKTSNAGAFADSGIVPDTVTGNDPDSDILEISIQGKTIKGKIFRQGVAVADDIFSVNYDVDSAGIPVPLFGYMIFHGARDKIEIIDFKFTPDAFAETNLVDYESFEDLTAIGVGARPLAARSRNTNKKIDFLSESITSFLGFSNIVNIVKGVNVTFIAEELFISTIENGALLILLENLPLESYDGFKKGRKSILATVPNTDIGSRIVYEPNNLNYIELNNANTVSLRNIRAKLLYQDYTPLKTKGFSVLNILIEN